MEAAVKGGTAKDVNGGAEKEEEEEEQKKSIPVVSIQPLRITMIRACQDPFRAREKSVCLCWGSFVLSCAQAGQDGRGLRKEKERRRHPWNGAAPSLLYSEGESERRRRSRRRGRVLLFSWSPGSEGNTPRLLSNSPLSKKRLALTGERKGRRRRRPTAVSWWQKKCCVPIPRTLKSSFFAWPLHKPTAKQTFSGRETSAGGGEERRDRREVSWTNEHRRGRRRRRRSKAEEEETEEEARRRGERNRLLISPSTEEEEVKNR